MEQKQTDSKEIAARFAALPKIVQDAINSAQIEKHMREIAQAHQLHLDLWGGLENQVMLTVMGAQRAEDLVANITKAIGIDQATAASIAEDISRIVFNPVRLELERHLSEIEAAPLAAPDASATPNTSSSASAGTASGTQVPAPIPPAPAPIAPPAAAPALKSRRAEISDSYTPGALSTERKDVHNDPYRESPA